MASLGDGIPDLSTVRKWATEFRIDKETFKDDAITVILLFSHNSFQSMLRKNNFCVTMALRTMLYEAKISVKSPTLDRSKNKD